MANLSRYHENAWLNHVLRNTAMTSPSTVYVALFTSDPGKTGSGTEVSGGSYARQAVTFSSPSAGETQNSQDVTFPVATASWGTVGYAAIMTAATGGERLFQGALDAPKEIGVNDQFKFAAGNLKVKLT